MPSQSRLSRLHLEYYLLGSTNKFKQYTKKIEYGQFGISMGVYRAKVVLTQLQGPKTLLPDISGVTGLGDILSTSE